MRVPDGSMCRCSFACLCVLGARRAGPQHRWLMTSDCLCIRVLGGGHPTAPALNGSLRLHWDRLLAASGYPTQQTDALYLQMVAWLGGCGLTERESWECGSEAQEPKPALQAVWVLARRCHLCGASEAAALCQRRLPPRRCWGAHECR